MCAERYTSRHIKHTTPGMFSRAAGVSRRRCIIRIGRGMAMRPVNVHGFGRSVLQNARSFAVGVGAPFPAQRLRAEQFARRWRTSCANFHTIPYGAPSRLTVAPLACSGFVDVHGGRKFDLAGYGYVVFSGLIKSRAVASGGCHECGGAAAQRRLPGSRRPPAHRPAFRRVSVVGGTQGGGNAAVVTEGQPRGQSGGFRYSHRPT